MMLGMQALFT